MKKWKVVKRGRGWDAIEPNGEVTWHFKTWTEAVRWVTGSERNG